MMLFSQITALSLADLRSETKKMERELLEITMAIRMQQEKNVSKRKKLRRTLARLHTALTQKTSSSLPSSAS